MAETTTTTRRLFLRSAAVVPAAVTMPAFAMAATPHDADPIFAAIEAHRQADAAFSEGLSGRATIEDERRSEARCNELGDVELAARASMLETTPTTLAGVLALIRYIRASEDAFGFQYLSEEDAGGFLATLDDALSSLAGQS